MRTMSAGVVVLAALMLAGPSVAEDRVAPNPPQQKTCLQNNRIYTWRVVNNRELIVGDIQGNVFTVRLSGGCVGLNDSILAMRFVTKTNLGCLSAGDRVSYREPVLGQMSCFVNEVRPGLEPKKDQKVEP